jgi:hypothetical protein
MRRIIISISIFTMFLLSLSSSPLMTSAVFAQTTNTGDTTTTNANSNNAGPMTFVDLENYGHSTGFSIYVPGGDWVIDSFSDGDGRTQTEEFAAIPEVAPTFEEAATLCEFSMSGTSALSPTTGKEYHCGAFGSYGFPRIHVRMYEGYGNPLQYHMSLYDYNTFYNGNKRVVNITDTTVDLVDPATNQTIQTIPAKVAKISLEQFDYHFAPVQHVKYIDTVLYATVPGTSDTYVITYILQEPANTFDSELMSSWAADEALAKEIFDSFRIMSK